MFYCDKCEVKYEHIHIMPMQDVLDTLSGDSDWLTGTVRDLLEEKRDYRYEKVKRSIISVGFTPGYEPEWEHYRGKNFVVNGHHRITALHDLGAQWCPDGRRDANVYA